ncbi:MAG: hypothetical protein KA146_00205 [Leptospiraceae bacterium]|nr:hypothetical protein [Leptospiraceae bacterium]
MRTTVINSKILYQKDITIISKDKENTDSISYWVHFKNEKYFTELSYGRENLLQAVSSEAAQNIQNSLEKEEFEEIYKIIIQSLLPCIVQFAKKITVDLNGQQKMYTKRITSIGLIKW